MMLQEMRDKAHRIIMETKHLEEQTLGHSTSWCVFGAEAILGSLGTQVYHLVKAEFAAID